MVVAVLNGRAALVKGISDDGQPEMGDTTNRHSGLLAASPSGQST
jgi:hypothetical protein